MAFLPACSVSNTYKEKLNSFHQQQLVSPQVSEVLMGNGSENDLVSWWNVFADSLLTKLIERGIENNRTLAAAVARVEEARYLRDEAIFAMLPRVNAAVGYNRNLASLAALRGLPAGFQYQTLYNAGFDASWEIDLFGRLRSDLRSRDALLEQAGYTLRDAHISLAAEIARSYFYLAFLQEELRVQRENADLQRETLKLIESLFAAGTVNEFDTARARALYNSTLGFIPILESDVQATIYRITVLLGEEKFEIENELKSLKQPPKTQAKIFVGDAAGLAARRPDVRASEAALRAFGFAAERSARDFLPQITLTAGWGYRSRRVEDIGENIAESWQFMPQINWQIFDFGTLRSRYKAADARAKEALANYEQALITALREAQTAIFDYARRIEQVEFLKNSAESSKRAYEISRMRYKEGLIDFLAVIQAAQDALSYQVSSVQAERDATIALITLYKALGGGFDYLQTVKK